MSKSRQYFLLFSPADSQWVRWRTYGALSRPRGVWVSSPPWPDVVELLVSQGPSASLHASAHSIWLPARPPCHLGVGVRQSANFYWCQESGNRPSYLAESHPPTAQLLYSCCSSLLCQDWQPMPWKALEPCSSCRKRPQNCRKSPIMDMLSCVGGGSLPVSF